MTTRTLTGTYSAGYTLLATTTLLSIASTGYVGGKGISSGSAVQNSPTVDNSGRVEATTTVSTDVGIYLGHGGTVINEAAGVVGGYVGVVVANGYGEVTNLGQISGGVALSSTGVVTNGSVSDHGATITGRTGVSIIGTNAHGAVTNYGSIQGGVTLGGRKSVDVVLNYGSIGSGAATSGVAIGYGGTVLNGSAGARAAQISGYIGVLDNPAAGTGTGVFIINGGTIQGSNARLGAGISLYNGAITNGSVADQAALISGFVGIVSNSVQAKFTSGVVNYGTVQGLGSLGGAGIILTDPGSVTNGSAVDHAAQISGSIGVKLMSNGQLNNFGTITGTYGKAVLLYSAQARFTVEAYSVVHGVVLSGAGGTLELAANTGTITNLGTSGVYAIATISGPESMKFIGFNTYQIDAGTNWTLAGADIVGTGHTLNLAGGINIAGTLFSTGNLVLAGSIGGAGTIDIAGGVASIGASLNFNGSVIESAGASVQIATGKILNLVGPATLAGKVDGPGQLWLRSAVANGLVVGGGLTIQVNGSCSQTGSMTLGDTSSGAVTLEILKAGRWDVGGNSIAKGAGGGRIADFGLLIKATGAGLSTVAVDMVDSGAVEVAVGTLEFAGRLFGTGTLKIDAGATLRTDGAVFKTLAVSFNGANAVLAIGNATGFAATIGGFSVTDTIDLRNVSATGASVNAGNQLVIVNGATTVATLQLTGAYTGATFKVASDGNTGTNITLATAPSLHAMAAAMAAMAPGVGVGAVLAARDPTAAGSLALARPGG